MKVLSFCLLVLLSNSAFSRNIMECGLFIGAESKYVVKKLYVNLDDNEPFYISRTDKDEIVTLAIKTNIKRRIKFELFQYNSQSSVTYSLDSILKMKEGDSFEFLKSSEVGKKIYRAVCYRGYAPFVVY